LEGAAHPECPREDCLSGEWKQGHLVLRRYGLEHLRRRNGQPACSQQMLNNMESKSSRSPHISKNVCTPSQPRSYIHKSVSATGYKPGFLVQSRSWAPPHRPGLLKGLREQDRQPKEGNPACLLGLPSGNVCKGSQRLARIHKSMSSTGYKLQLFMQS